jgi:hypothetical protein
MNRLRYLSLALVLVAAALATGTGAFTSVNGDRAMAVSVVENDEALLGISANRIELDNGVRRAGTNDTDGNPNAAGARDDVTLLTITNRFPESLSQVSVSRVGDGASGPPNILANSLSYDTQVESGGSIAVTARVVCSNANGNEETWRFRIEASGESASVETTESVTVECTGEPPAAPADQAITDG